MSGGRPTKYTEQLASRICREIAGGRSLVKVCEPRTMPHRDTVYAWLVERETFSDMYARAVERRADSIVDEAMETARAATRETAAADRLRVDTLKWAAAKFCPRKYSEKTQVEQSGGLEIRVVRVPKRHS